MKSFIYVAIALVAMGVLTSSASAADNQVSTSSLNAAGLPGFAPISDAQGMTVRGKFAAVGGITVATAPGAFSANGYVATGHTSASGGAFSLAVSGVGGSIGGVSGFIVAGSVAAGVATAHAH